MHSLTAPTHARMHARTHTHTVSFICIYLLLAHTLSFIYIHSLLTHALTVLYAFTLDSQSHTDTLTVLYAFTHYSHRHTHCFICIHLLHTNLPVLHSEFILHCAVYFVLHIEFIQYCAVCFVLHIEFTQHCAVSFVLHLISYSIVLFGLCCTLSSLNSVLLALCYTLISYSILWCLLCAASDYVDSDKISRSEYEQLKTAMEMIQVLCHLSTTPSSFGSLSVHVCLSASPLSCFTSSGVFFLFCVWLFVFSSTVIVCIFIKALGCIAVRRKSIHEWCETKQSWQTRLTSWNTWWCSYRERQTL